MEDFETQAVPKKRDYFLPISILLAALLISGSLVYNAGKRVGSPTPNDGGNVGATVSGSNLTIRPVGTDDHVLGNPNAKVTIIEFSDLECPFCKMFHPTLQNVLQVYGDKVRWVYRHYPLDALHPKARKEAEASECAYEQGGDKKFWDFVDKVFSVTPSNNGLDPAQLPKIAESIGLDVTQFSSCLSSDKYKDRVERDVKDAQAAGIHGTPYSVIVAPNGKLFPINGAVPIEDLKSILDTVTS